MGSVVQQVLSMHKTLCLIASTKKQQQKVPFKIVQLPGTVTQNL
jgi:hypothetical protein